MARCDQGGWKRSAWSHEDEPSAKKDRDLCWAGGACMGCRKWIWNCLFFEGGEVLFGNNASRKGLQHCNLTVQVEQQRARRRLAQLSQVPLCHFPWLGTLKHLLFELALGSVKSFRSTCDSRTSSLYIHRCRPLILDAPLDRARHWHTGDLEF